VVLDDNGDFVVGGTGAAGEPSDPTSLQKIVGGKLVKLEPGESLDSFQSNRPSPTFTGFLEHLRRDSALGMIPFEFAADSSKVGGAGVRLIVAKADRRQPPFSPMNPAQFRSSRLFRQKQIPSSN
jgi:hypothetical protein